jgi:cytidyltransferase-like protein
MKYGVILARFQPVHNGHLALIKKAYDENDKVLLLIGSADKSNVRNPIPFNIRRELLESALSENKMDNKCIILGLDDLTSEKDNNIEWGFYLYANIVKHIKETEFTIYYSDGYEIITTWFTGYILRNHVSLSLIARNSMENGISATKVRDLIINSNDVELKKVVPTSVYDLKNTLKIYLSLYN